MSKPLIVIADMDTAYLAELENKFLVELGDRAELEIISDPEYFEQFFSNPVTAEIVAVNENLYTNALQRQDIQNLFILSEHQEQGRTEELSVSRVYKYYGIKELYNELTYKSQERLEGKESGKRETTIIALYSAIGGTGKTSLSVGLAECLAKKHKRILYVNTAVIQAFFFYLSDKSGMSNEGYRAIKEDAGHIYQNIRSFIRKEGFSYIPPFLSTLDARNLSYDIYLNLIRGARESKEYDFIIVDIEAGYEANRVQLLQEADKVLLITMQDAISTCKMEYIMQNLDFRDHEKYLVIMNRYRGDEMNCYMQSELQAQFPVKEKVYETETPLGSAEQLAALEGIKKLSYMFI